MCLIFFWNLMGLIERNKENMISQQAQKKNKKETKWKNVSFAMKMK